MEKNLYAILCDFTVEEIEFLIRYYEGISMIGYIGKVRELKNKEKRIHGATLKEFNVIQMWVYKVGLSCRKDKYEKFAQQLNKKCINERDFFLLTVAICEKNPEVVSYIATPYGC